MMSVLEIEKMVRDPEKLDLVLEELVEDFEAIEDYENKAKTYSYDDTQSIRKAFQLMDGLYGKLRRVSGIVEQEAKEVEVKKYNILLMEISNKNGKVTTIEESSAKKQALEAATPYYRVASRINGYFDSCDKHFSHLQSMLRKAESEEDRKKGGLDNE